MVATTQSRRLGCMQVSLIHYILTKSWTTVWDHYCFRLATCGPLSTESSCGVAKSHSAQWAALSCLPKSCLFSCLQGHTPVCMVIVSLLLPVGATPVHSAMCSPVCRGVPVYGMVYCLPEFFLCTPPHAEHCISVLLVVFCELPV